MRVNHDGHLTHCDDELVDHNLVEALANLRVAGDPHQLIDLFLRSNQNDWTARIALTQQLARWRFKTE